MQVILVALENRVFLDAEDDIQIARARAVGAGMSGTALLEPRARIHSRRYGHLELALAAHHAFALALHAGTADDLAAPVALPACAPDRQERLLVQHLAAPLADRARGQTVVRLGSGAFAARTLIVAGNLNLDRRAFDRVFERQREVIADILAPRRSARATAAPAAGTKQIAEAEGPEDVFKIRKCARVEASTAAAGVDALMPEAIVGRAFLPIAQDGIGLGRFTEMFLGALVAGVAVGMVFQGELAIGGLQGGLIGLAFYP